MNYIFVAVGGALGAVGRYAIGLAPIKAEFPIATFVVNIIGAILIGFIVGFFDGREGISPNALLFWKTGVCGGFTTFSTFSLETVKLFEQKLYLIGGAYAILSVLCCVIGVIVGHRLALFIR